MWIRAVWESIGNILSPWFCQVFFCPENLICVFLAMRSSTRPEGSESVFLGFIIIGWEVRQMSDNWSQPKIAGIKRTDHNIYYHHHCLGLVMDLLAVNERQHLLLARRKSPVDRGFPWDLYFRRQRWQRLENPVTSVVRKVCETILRVITACKMVELTERRSDQRRWRGWRHSCGFARGCTPPVWGSGTGSRGGCSARLEAPAAGLPGQSTWCHRHTLLDSKQWEQVKKVRAMGTIAVLSNWS